MLDVYGFSRLMAADESGTLARVLKQQRDIIQPLIASHDGRVVKLMGDGVLAEFPSVTAAVQSAVEIQKSVASHAEMAEADPLLVRIGINLGEVIADGTDIYGDGVNVAARIEALAQPGGIALSGAAHAQLKIRPPLNFEDMGPHHVKNIPEPVQVFHLGADLAEAAPRPAAAPAGVRRKRGVRATLMAGCVTAVLVGGGWVLFGQTLWPGAAVVSAVGSLTEAHIRFADQQVAKRVKGPLEVVSLSGTLGPDGPHLHLSVSDHKGRTRGGHLAKGSSVYTTLELVILVFDDVTMTRPVDPVTGYGELLPVSLD